MSTSHQTGGDVDTLCRRCKLSLAHVIVAMHAGRILRVKCKTCQSEHAYRYPAATPARKPRAAPASSRAKSPSRAQALYASIMHGHELAESIRYRITHTFAANDVMEHVKFGRGIVVRVLADSKVEVIFPDGARILVHAR